MAYRKHRWIVAVALALGVSAVISGARPGNAQVADPGPRWCELDGPGHWRTLRATARVAGNSDVADCPTGGDPATLADRLVIPLPCGRAIEMVRVDIPARNVLDDLRVGFGGAPEQAGLLTRYIQGARQQVVSGAFTVGGPDPAQGYDDLEARSFYIATHEWTELQHALHEAGILSAIAAGQPLDDACAQIAARAQGMRFGYVRPQTGLSWYDAQALLRDLNGYAIAEGNRRVNEGGAPILPWEKGSTGFFRLPSDAEWEFAARGGVGGVVIGGALHAVMEDGQLRTANLDEIAQLATGRGSGDALGGVGGRLPNAIGLFDTVGNVAEMTHDLFGLIRPDRGHGALGGVTLRGGNALTPGNIIGVPHRQELALFSADGEGRSPMGGLRLVVSAPLITRGHDPSGARAPDLPNPDLDEATLRGHRALVLVGDSAGATFRDEARTLLAQLQADVGTASGSIVSPEQVAEVSRALEQSEAAINSARSAEIKARVRSSVDLILLIRNLSAISLTWLADLEEARETVAKITDSRRPALDERLRLAFANVDGRIALIGVQVAELQRGLRNLAESDPARVKTARDEITQEMRAAEIDIYDEWAWPLFDGALELVRSDTGGEHAEELRRRFDIFAAERAEKYGR